MSDAFGWQMHELEEMLISLIDKGEISARVDRMNMVSPNSISVHLNGWSMLSDRF